MDFGFSIFDFGFSVRRAFVAFGMVMIFCVHARGAEPKTEHIRGVLEKTTRPDASAQITDSLGETYYIAKSEATEKLVAPYVGKPKKVVITGVVEARANGVLYFVLKTIGSQ